MGDTYQLIIQVIGEDQTGPAEQGMSKLSAGTVALGNLMADAMKSAASAVVGFGADSIKVAGDFESGMNQFAAAAGDSLSAAGLSVDDFRNQFLQLGAELPVSTMEVQDAAIALIKGGLDPATVAAGGLESSLKFAGAAGMGLADAAELGVKILGTFGDANATAAEQSQFLAQAQDLITKAAGASTVDVDKLGDAMLAAAGAAKGAGVGYADFTTIMGAISKSFGSAAEEGTSYKNFLTRLNPTTANARDAMGELGLMTTNTGNIMKFLGEHGIKPLGTDLDTLGNQFTEWATTQGWTTKEIGKFWDENFRASKFFDEQTGAFVGNREAAELLQNALAGLSDQQRSTAMAAIFGNDAAGAAIAMADLGAEGYDRFAAQMAAANGVAQQYEATQKGLTTAWSNFTGSIEAAQIVIGTALLPILTLLLNDVLAPAVNTIREFAAALFSASDPVQFLVTTIGGAMPIITGVGSVILGGLVVAFYAWATAAWAAATATLTAMAPVLLPIIAIGAAVALLTAAWQNNWGNIQGITASVWSTISPYFDQLVTWLQVNIPIAIAAAAQLWSTVLWPALQAVGAYITGTVIPALINLYTYLATTVPAGISVLVGWWNTAVAAVTGFAASVQAGYGVVTTSISAFVASVQAGWSVVVAGAQATWNTVTTTISTFIASIRTGFGVVVGYLAGVWAGIVAGATVAWQGLVGVISTVVGVITTVIMAGWNTIQFLTATAMQALIGIIAPIVQSIAAVIGPPIAAVVSTVVNNWLWLASVATSVWTALVGAASAAWASLLSAATAAWSAITGTVAAGSAATAGVATSAWAALAGAATSAWGAITGTVATGVATIVAVASAGWATLSNTASTAWAAIVGVVAAAWNGLWAAVGAGMALVEGMLAAGWAAAASSTQAAWANVQTIIAGAWSIIQAVVQAAVSIVTTWATGAWAAIVAASQNDFTKVGEIIRSTWESIKGTFASALGSIKASFQEMLGAAVELGRNIVSGIISGITGAAGKLFDSLKNLASSALSAAKNAIQSHSPSVLFANQVGQPITEGIALGIQQASPKAVGAMLDLASKLIDVVSRGVDAFGKLSQLGTIPQGAVQRFADSIMGALTVFSAMTQTWDKASMSAASQFTKKAGDVVDMLAKGVDFLLKLQTLQAIPAQAIHAFVSALDLTMRELVAISTQQMRIGLMGAVEFAGGAGKLLDVVGKGVESLSKLSTFQAVPLTAFLAFRAALKSAIYTFTQAVQEWSTAPIASAAAFADSSGKMLDVIGKGAESLSKLAEFAGVPLTAFLVFRAALKSAIYTFTQAAAEWAGAPVGAAVQFAQTSATILDTIGKGIDGLTKLRGFEGTPLAAFVSFRAALAQAVATMIAIAQSFAASAVDAAGTFATSAGKVVGIIGSAVDGFTKLAAFEGVTDAAFVDFGSALFYTIDLFVAIAADWDAKAVEAAGVFATGAGKVVGIIGNGVEGLTKLADLKPVAQSSIQLFVAMTNDLMIRIGAAASGFSADALAAAGKFADAAGKTVGILKNGVDGFLTVDTFTGVSQAAINRFADGVRMAVTAMAAMATSFGADAVAAANTFAKAAGESTDFLKKGVEGFNKLTELEGVPAAGLKVFADTVVALIQTTIKLGTLISNEMFAEATRIANGTDQVIEVVKNAIKAFLTLGEATGQLPNYIQGFVTAVAELMADFQRAVLPPAQNIGAAISLGIAAGITSQAGAIQNAVYAAVNQALAAARAALGIASPSKVFEQQIGLQMSAGMAKGVLGGMGGVQAAVSQVSGGAIGGVGSTTNNNQRTFAPGAIQIQVIAGDSKNARAMADEVATELERRLGLVG